jgi:hypothetical protein
LETKYDFLSSYFLSPTLRLGPLCFNTSVCKSNFPLARKEDKRCFFSSFRFFVLPGNGVETSVLDYSETSLYERQFGNFRASFSSRDTTRYFHSISFCCRDKTCVVTLKSESAMFAQVPDLHSLQSQPCQSVLVRWVSSQYFNPQTVNAGWGLP